LSVSLASLTRFLHQPRSRSNWRFHTLGKLAVLEATRAADSPHGRWLTLLAFDQRFLFLVDEFQAPEPATFALTLRHAGPLQGRPTRHPTHVEREPFAIHPLGDYGTERSSDRVTWRQRLGHGRFLVGLTRDRAASVRVLNGWAVEVRSEGCIKHLLIANGAGRLRPLGPVQTDARFAIASWGEDQGPSTTGFGADLLLVQATKLHWGPNSRLSASEPFDLEAASS
jgi:hypothetical protein